MTHIYLDDNYNCIPTTPLNYNPQRNITIVQNVHHSFGRQFHPKQLVVHLFIYLCVFPENQGNIFKNLYWQKEKKNIFTFISGFAYLRWPVKAMHRLLIVQLK